MTYSTSAIILRRRDLGEWDRLYTVYTREHGKCSLIAKGTRRPRAKLASHLEPYSEVELVIARGRAIDRVTFARTITSSARFAIDWERLRLAAFACECVDQLTHEAHRDVAVFDLLHDTLNAIAQYDLALVTCHPPPITPFILRFLSLLGYTPQLDRCVECRSIIASGEVLGIPSRGGVACARCGLSVHNGILLEFRDREQIAAAAASFHCFSVSVAVYSYALAFLETHLVAPLRTFSLPNSLTCEQAPVTMAVS